MLHRALHAVRRRLRNARYVVAALFNLTASGSAHFGGGRKGLFVLLRYLFILTAAYLLVFEAPGGKFGSAEGLMLAVALASNIVLSAVPEERLFAWYVEAPVLVADTLWVSWALYSTGTIGQEFFLLYFFVLSLAALGESLLLVLVGSTVISVVNLYFTNPPLWTTPHLLRIVFFYVVALFYGNVLTEIRRERQRADKGFAWAKELEVKVAERTDELRRLYNEAQAASRLKSDFIATMSHELRAPLNAIIGHTDLLLEGEYGSLTAKQREILQVVTRRQLELNDVINETLGLSRLEAGTVTLHLSRVDLREVLGVLADEARAAWVHPNVECIWTVASNLPGLYTDRAKLKTVLRNLLENAAKFTARGQITIAACRSRGGIEIAVADTGPGIRQDQQGLIFEAFHQVEDSSMTRRNRGVGLGLYIVRRLLTLLNGEIALESAVGHGSTFRVWLPASAEGPPMPLKEGYTVPEET